MCQGGAAHAARRRSVSAFLLRNVIPVGDGLIADRMGQYASGTAADRLEQARILLRLHPDAEMDYLDRRIREETGGDYGLEDLQS